MLHDIIFLLLGLILLVIGANYVTDGSVAVAQRFNVSNLIIGLTVVALGSTLPDIVVCVESALQHKPAIAVGEVIGSNIFDMLLVVGIMAIVRPFKVDNIMRTQDLPILFIASSALWIAGDTILFDGHHNNTIDRSSGVLLIIIFIFYMWFMILSSKQEKSQSSSTSPHTPPSSAAPTSTQSKPIGVVSAHTAKAELSTIKSDISDLRRKQWFSWILIVVGLGALVVGGNWVVDGASGLALKIGMSQAMVAITVVAIGNALPDLVTSVTATLKGASGLAFGNIVGSCIINALLTIGLSSLVTPLTADAIGFVDFSVLAGAAAIIWLIPLITKKHDLTRIPGILLSLLYIAYFIFTIIRG